MSKYESGTVHFDIDALWKIAEIFGITPSLLVSEAEKLLIEGKEINVSLEAEEPGYMERYLYYYDGTTNRLSKNIMFLSHTAKKDKYNVDLFNFVSDIHDPFSCEVNYSGTMYYSEQYMNFILQNVSNKTETLLFVAKEKFNDKDTLCGILTGISIAYSRPCSYHALLSKHILHEETALADSLKLTRKDLELVKETNCFMFQDG